MSKPSYFKPFYKVTDFGKFGFTSLGKNIHVYKLGLHISKRIFKRSGATTRVNYGSKSRRIRLDFLFIIYPCCWSRSRYLPVKSESLSYN